MIVPRLSVAAIVYNAKNNSSGIVWGGMENCSGTDPNSTIFSWIALSSSWNILPIKLIAKKIMQLCTKNMRQVIGVYMQKDLK